MKSREFIVVLQFTSLQALPLVLRTFVYKMWPARTSVITLYTQSSRTHTRRHTHITDLYAANFRTDTDLAASLEEWSVEEARKECRGLRWDVEEARF